jgi:primosomal protein N' (replication factor Y)
VAEALALMEQARGLARALAAATPVTVYDPVPMPLVRLANRERAQLLLESASRRALHGLLDALLPQLRALKTAVRWQLEVDPAEI